ncbi:UNVERIFIED_CONTAM: hypothetical protein Sindi_1869800 [Sesamum indicum]
MAERPGIQPSTSSSDHSSSQDSPKKQTQVIAYVVRPAFRDQNNYSLPPIEVVYSIDIVPVFDSLSSTNWSEGLDHAVYETSYQPDKELAPTFASLKSANGNIPTFPIMYPALVPGLFPPHQDQEQINRGPGLYAVPVLPYMQPIAGLPPNTLIPFTYNIPTYQTGALAPVIRWLSQGMRRAAAPPQPPRPPVRADNLPVAGGQGNENGGLAEGQPIGENENQQVNDGNRAIENEHAAGEPGQVEVGNRWWGIGRGRTRMLGRLVTSLEKLHGYDFTHFYDIDLSAQDFVF